jgi:hypothetical protein
MLDGWPVHRSPAFAVPRTCRHLRALRDTEELVRTDAWTFGRNGLEPGTGMLIDRAPSVHMFFGYRQVVDRPGVPL